MRKKEEEGKGRKPDKTKPEKGPSHIAQGLQKELDALVSPISVRAERQGERREVQVVKKQEADLKKPIEKEHPIESKQEEGKVKPAKKKVKSWGIVIGETD